jgi:hypothetical protein
MNGLQLPPFRMIHAAYVTHDVERGKRRLASLFGVIDFTEYPEIEVEVPGGVAKIAFALANANGTNLEVIQPIGEMDHVYRQVLPDDPDDIAFHHFATSVESEAEWQMIMDAVGRHGFDTPVLSSGNSKPRYIYLDARPRLGHMLEYIWGSLDGTD